MDGIDWRKDFSVVLRDEMRGCMWGGTWVHLLSHLCLLFF
jgi:hypothetical protein